MKKLLIGLLISCSCLGVSCNIPNSISSPQNDSHNYNSNVEDFYLDQNKKNDIQPYIDAKDYLQEELDDTEYNFYVSLNKDDIDLILKHINKLSNGLFEMRYFNDGTC